MIFEKKNVDKKLVKSIAAKYSCDTLTAFILVKRGITSENEIPYFLSDDPCLLRDPFLLPDIKKAVNRIVQARIQQEKVLVFGDRDVDGITGTVMLFDYLCGLGINASWRVPTGEEPYGLSIKAVEDFRAAGGGLIITVDCGISGTTEVSRAHELGLSVIITDHHVPRDIVPPALAIVNPKLPGSAYPFRDISGCMVAYKLVLALQKTLGDQGNPNFTMKDDDYLQLVTLGTVADIMPLRDENRIIVRKGLHGLISKPMAGISELLLILGLSGKPVGAEELSWVLCPAINAAGRMGVPEKAVAVLIEKDPRKRLALAGEIKELNEKRKRLGTKTLPVVERLATKNSAPFDGKLLVAAHQEISRGITGVMANRLMEKYHIPAMVVHLGEDLAVGSIRSPGSYEVRLLAEPLQDLLLNYGGHENALGFSMDRRNWEPYLARLEIEIGFISLQEVSPTDADTIDAELPRRYMTPDIFKIVDRFEPYGTGNKPLVFAARELKVLDSRFLGKTRPKHIKLTVDAGEYKWPAILWDGINKPAADINAGDTVDMLYTFNRNWYKGIEYPQIIIRDICKSAVI